MHQIITGSAARHNSGVRHNFRADCNTLLNRRNSIQKAQKCLFMHSSFTKSAAQAQPEKNHANRLFLKLIPVVKY